MHYRKNRLGHLLEGWRPPAGVRKSHPRDVTYTHAGWAVWVCLWLLAVGGVAAVVGLGTVVERQTREAQLLQEQGVETAAWITRLWRGRDDAKTPWVAFEFEAGGRKYVGRSKAKLSVWRMLQLGGEYRIRYAASDPRIHHPVNRAPEPMPFFVPYLVGAFCFGGAMGLRAILRRQRYLLGEGRIAPGVITEVQDKRTQHGERHVAVYEFPLLSGGVGKGKTIPQKKDYFVGQKVCVVYLPDDWRKNGLYPLSLVKQAGVMPQEKRVARVVRKAGGSLRRATA